MTHNKYIFNIMIKPFLPPAEMQDPPLGQPAPAAPAPGRALSGGGGGRVPQRAGHGGGRGGRAPRHTAHCRTAVSAGQATC